MRTHTVAFLAIATILGTANGWSDSAVYEKWLSTATPTAIRDPWQCVMANLSQYFDLPKPTGSLLSAIISNTGKLIEVCTLTDPIDRMYRCYATKQEWCKVTTAVPASFIPDCQLSSDRAIYLESITMEYYQVPLPDILIPQQFSNFTILIDIAAPHLLVLCT